MKIVSAVDEPIYKFKYNNNTKLYDHILDNEKTFFSKERRMSGVPGYVKSYDIQNYDDLPKEFYNWVYSCFKEVIIKEAIERGDFFINQMWLNKMTEPGELHVSHFHPNSIMSGTYSIRCMKPNNRMLVFNQSQTEQRQLFVLLNEEEKDRRKHVAQFYGDREKFHDNDTGTLVIHRSNVLHAVPPFEPAGFADFRLTISFNIWLNELGRMRHATGLLVKQSHSYVNVQPFKKDKKDEEGESLGFKLFGARRGK